jgi:hypothetical protein
MYEISRDNLGQEAPGSGREQGLYAEMVRDLAR